jgi:hypothetical protein
MNPLEVLKKVANSHADNECTGWPVWFIINPKMMRAQAIPSMFDGPFFSRETAEDYLTRNRSRYGKKAYVFCKSAKYDAPDYRQLYDASVQAFKDDNLIPGDLEEIEKFFTKWTVLPGGYSYRIPKYDDGNFAFVYKNGDWVFSLKCRTIAVIGNHADLEECKRLADLALAKLLRKDR